MSRPSEPVETTSISIDLSFLPSFMIEPLPKFRSIWDSAASSALDLSLSIEIPSITRRLAEAIVLLLMAGIRRSDKRAPLPALRPPSTKNYCTLFVLRSQYVLFRFLSVLASAQYQIFSGMVGTNPCLQRSQLNLRLKNDIPGKVAND